MSRADKAYATFDEWSAECDGESDAVRCRAYVTMGVQSDGEVGAVRRDGELEYVVRDTTRKSRLVVAERRGARADSAR